MDLAFYIHIPYCIKRCGYCDFNTYTPSELKITTGLKSITSSYTNLLITEIKSARKQVGERAVVPSIFFGGGTPSLMEAEEIKSIINVIGSEFDLASDIEITLESNPDTVDKEKLEKFYQAGINRISFGMQSAVPHVLATLDRTHNPCLLYTSPSPRDRTRSRMPSSA